MLSNTTSKRALALFMTAALAGTAAPQDCPIAGFSAMDVGQGTGFLQPSRLQLTWDAVECRLGVEVQTFSCCNTYATQHFVVFGDGLLAAPLTLGRPFLAGSQLYARRSQVYGPIAGLTSSFDVPPDPALVGKSFVAQAAPMFFTTIGLRRDWGVTQAVVFTFQ